MEIGIKAIKFDATEKLQGFIQKKVTKLERLCGEIRKVEVSLKVVKPAAALNKQVIIVASLPGEELIADKTCDTFEEATDQCLAALEKQLAIYKEKQGKN